MFWNVCMPACVVPQQQVLDVLACLGWPCAFMGPRTVALRLVHVLLLLSLVCLQVPDCRSWVAYSGGTMVVVPEFTLGGLGPLRASL